MKNEEWGMRGEGGKEKKNGRDAEEQDKIIKTWATGEERRQWKKNWELLYFNWQNCYP